MALLNHRCGDVPHRQGHKDFVIHGRILVRQVPVISCKICGYWGTRHEDSSLLGQLAGQLGHRKEVLPLDENPPRKILLIVHFASLPFAKTEH